MEILGVDAFGPAVSLLLLERPTGEIEPSLVEKGVKFVRARDPDHHGRGIGDRAESALTLANGGLRMFCFSEKDRQESERNRRDQEEILK
jgi:hypothetical protein